MDRTEIIQRLIDKYGLQSYLEIGVQNSAKNFDKIRCKIKIGVDPDPDAKGVTCFMTSDEYFANKPKSIKYDIIFIDGLHIEEQVTRDTLNSLASVNKNGFIVCHDMNPPTELHQIVPRVSKQWNGDCWKSWVKLRQTLPMSMMVVDCDWGVGIISAGGQELLQPILNEELTYENLEKNRQVWLNLVSPNYFERMYL